MNGQPPNENAPATTRTAHEIGAAVVDYVGLNARLIDQGCEFLSRIDDEQYATLNPTISDSSIGAHVRHCLDFYEALLLGVSKGTIDYDDRQRESIIETDRGAAISWLSRVKTGLLALEANADRKLDVRLTSADGRTTNATTSLVRELETAASHTIHHYAIIAIHARTRGLEVDRSFGVAVSTLRYRAEQERSQG